GAPNGYLLDALPPLRQGRCRSSQRAPCSSMRRGSFLRLWRPLQQPVRSPEPSDAQLHLIRRGGQPRDIAPSIHGIVHVVVLSDKSWHGCALRCLRPSVALCIRALLDCTDKATMAPGDGRGGCIPARLCSPAHDPPADPAPSSRHGTTGDRCAAKSPGREADACHARRRCAPVASRSPPARAAMLPASPHPTSNVSSPRRYRDYNILLLISTDCVLPYRRITRMGRVPPRCG